MPGRPPLRRLHPGLLLLALLPACTGGPAPDTGPVELGPLPPAGAEVVELCRELLEALPAEVDPGVERRPVTPDTGRTAAWGDPPVTLECGAAAPERLEPPIDVNGVVWTTRDIGPGFRWTTANRVVRVAVTVPDAYENGIEIMFPLSPAVDEALPVDPTVPDPTQPGAPGLAEPPPAS